MRLAVERSALVLPLLAVWQALPSGGLVDPFFISSPVEIAQKLAEWIGDGELVRNATVTITEALLGLLLGSVLGAACGLVCGLHAGLRRAFLPLMTVGNALPRLAFAPLLIAWFGFGLSSKIVLSASIVFFFIFFGVYNGIRAGSGLLIANARILGGSGLSLLWHVYLPQAFGWIITSLRLAVAYAFAGAVVGEYLGSDSGLGYLIVYGKEMLDMTQVFAGITVVIMIVACLDAVVRTVGQAGSRWRGATAPQLT
jgi:NitT/TauT family transport system permease protein